MGRMMALAVPRGARRPSGLRLGALRRGTRAFTLVEALVAMAVFSVGLATLMPLVIANLRANDGAAVRSRAVSLAQGQAEELRALEYELLRTLAAAPPAPRVVGGIYTVELAFPVAPPLAGDEDDLTRILVSVGWDLGARGTGEVSFLTAKARY
ncbi:MAG: prepilin-type N-terminal cleavage/methylation domain-containing protein [Thermodesulfobacteriota bacterium]